MKTRTLFAVILGVLVVTGVSLAQDTAAPEQELQEPAFQQSDSPDLPQQEPSFVAQAEPPIGPGTPRPARPLNEPPVLPTWGASKSPTEAIIFNLKHADATELANMIRDIFRVTVHVVRHRNRLVVSATKEQMKSIADLITQIDVGLSKASTPRDVQDFVYRIYMFEIASGDEDMKPFSLILQAPPEASTMQLLDAAPTNRLQINGFCLSDERDRDGKAEILIQGKASSHGELKRIVYDAIPESRIKELKWDDAETFTDEVETAKIWQLPKQMQKNIGKLLGNDIRTVGYWFGNVSAPGEVEAPIGPWTLKLALDTESDRMLELNVDVEVPAEIHPFEIRLGRERKDKILSNMIRAKIGKPIIIGYNRQSYGTRKMGAMVILMEADTVQLSEPQKKAL